MDEERRGGVCAWKGGLVLMEVEMDDSGDDGTLVMALLCGCVDMS